MRDTSFAIEDEDSPLVLLSQRGDLKAFERLVEKYQKRMINIAYRLIGHYEESCDVVQDSFISAYKNIKSFKGSSKFQTWLTTIVINYSRNQRKKIRNIKYNEAVSLNTPISQEDKNGVIDLPSNDPPADVLIERKKIQTMIHSCINQLEGEFKEAIVLRDIEGYSYEDISDMLKIPVGTVKSRLFRARAILRDILKKRNGIL